MKRLLMSLISVGMVLAMTSSSAAAITRFWKVQISDPAATTDKSLNIDYNVSSTVSEDTFTVELFQNGASKGTQNVTHPNGNSGVFTIAIPAAGTYSYMVRATNHGAGDTTKDSDMVTVQVSDEPQPTVTTVSVNQAPNAQTAGTTGGLGGGGAAAAPATAGGQVAGAASGTTPAQAATTEGTGTANNAGSSVLGAEATANKTKAVNNSKRNIAIGSAVLLIAAGVAYGLYRRRALN